MKDNIISWRDYCVKTDKHLDSWILSDYSENANLLNKYALFNEPISHQYEWYQKHPYEMSNLGSYFKVAIVNNDVVSLIIINYGKDDLGRLVCGINPIIVDPNLINNGYGSFILNDFFKNAEKILNSKIDVFYAGIDEKNIVSKHIFIKFGFKQVGLSEDKEFVYYELENVI